MFSKVLVAIKPGFTKSAAVARAKVLAQATSVDLMLYSAVHEDSVSRSSFGTAEALKNLEDSMLKSEIERLEEVKGHLAGLCNSVTILAEWQAPVAQGILAAAESFGADLIVLACSTHAKLGRLFLTNTDWDVIRHASVPVLIGKDASSDRYASILAAVDPTHRHDKLEAVDNRVLETSKTLQVLFDAELYLGHVVPTWESSSVDTCMPPLDEFDSWRDYRDALMEKFAERHGVAQEHVRRSVGVPADGIVELAHSLQVDLVVMGSLSRTFSRLRVLGGTTESLTQALDCDVLLLPPPSGS